MSNKLVFRCNACGCEGTINVDEDHDIICCPSCGNIINEPENDDFDYEE